MKKIRFMSIVLALMMVLSTSALASGEASGGASMGRYLIRICNLVPANLDEPGAAIHVNELTLEAGTVWNVTGESDAATLTVANGAEVIVPSGGTITVDGAIVDSLGEGTYGNVTITP